MANNRHYFSRSNSQFSPGYAYVTEGWRRKDFPAKLRRIAASGIVGSATAGGIALCGSYAHARHYLVRHRKVTLRLTQCPTSSARRIRILHFSDFHTSKRNKKLLRFISSLADTDPDLIIFTGDLICEDDAISPLLQALEPYRGCPGLYVYGSNDYYKPRIKNPASYLLRNSNQTSRPPRPPHPLSTHRLTEGLDNLGFINLTNSRAQLSLQTILIDAVGVDDAHINRDVYPNKTSSSLDKHSPSSAILNLGLTHAPYTRVLNRMSKDGCALIFAGHTHGGQICLPGHHALVTNCDLPAHYASGFFTWPNDTYSSSALSRPCTPTRRKRPDRNPTHPRSVTSRFTNSSARTWVNISAGLGTAPFFPFRTWCAPEACILDVTCK